MFLLVFPSPCSERHATISFGRRATGVKRYSSRHIAQVHGVCTTGARERSQRARQPTLYPISCLSADALSIICCRPLRSLTNSTDRTQSQLRKSLSSLLTLSLANAFPPFLPLSYITTAGQMPDNFTGKSYALLLPQTNIGTSSSTTSLDFISALLVSVHGRHNKTAICLRPGGRLTAFY